MKEPRSGSVSFDRAAAYGMRLDIPAGTAVRFEPGDTRAVDLVAIGGTRSVIGLNRLVEGRLGRSNPRAAGMEMIPPSPSAIQTWMWTRL